MEKGPCCGSSDPGTIKERTRAKYDEQWGEQTARAAAERRKNLAMITDPLLAMVHPLAGKTVVDLGIGTGCLAFRALELSPPRLMIGIDFSAPGLCVVREISRHGRFEAMECEVVRGDLERIPLANRSVDVVLSQATLNLLPDKCTALREIARIAKPGAKVALSDAFRSSRVVSDDEPWEQCVAGALTVSEFSTLALSSGLIISGQVDLTQQAKLLVSTGKWDWPEFLRHNMDYRAFLLLKS